MTHRVHIIDSHTGDEPTHVGISGTREAGDRDMTPGLPCCRIPGAIAFPEKHGWIFGVAAFAFVMLICYRLQSTHPKVWRWILMIVFSVCLFVILWDRLK